MRRSTKLNIGLFAGAILAFGSGSVIAFGGDGGGDGSLRAHAVVEGAPGSGVEGVVRFTQAPADADAPTPGVRVVASVTGLSPGLHGLHIHENGVCEPPSFTAAGGHYDPGPYGNSNPDANHPFHMGDLPNLVADAAGAGHLSAITSRVTLSAGPTTLFDADGSAVIVHLNPDQGIPGPPGSGVSGGPRVACGVIVPDA